MGEQQPQTNASIPVVDMEYEPMMIERLERPSSSPSAGLRRGLAVNLESRHHDFHGSPTKTSPIKKGTTSSGKIKRGLLSKKKFSGISIPPPLYVKALEGTGAGKLSLEELLRDDSGHSNESDGPSLDTEQSHSNLNVRDPVPLPPSSSSPSELADMLDEASKVALSVGAAIAAANQQPRGGCGSPPLNQERRRGRAQRRNSFVIHRNRPGGFCGGLLGSGFGSSFNSDSNMHASCSALPVCREDSNDNSDEMMAPPSPSSLGRCSSMGPLGLPRHEGRLVLEHMQNAWAKKHQLDGQEEV